jgi:hypothetical protein
MKPALVAAVSFAATALFFFEYLPWAKRVHLFSDIEGYHYPLYTYAHRLLRQGELPEWDASIYCGISYAGNAQAGLFYPPNWLVYFANRMHRGIRFWTIEALAFLHVWVAWFCAWLWLRHRARSDLAAALGASVVAYGGWMVSEMQHLGAIASYAWIPLALGGVERRSWRQVAAASALSFLAGYPSSWLVLVVITGAYALAIVGWAATRIAITGGALSLGLIAVQLAPLLEAAKLKASEPVYGAGIPGGWFFYLQYLLPNYYDQAFNDGRVGSETEQYLYLGACFLAVVWWARDWRPTLAILGAAALFAWDPLGLMKRLVYALPAAAELVREWNFLSAIPIAAALVVASGVDRFPTIERRRWVVIPAALAWTVWLLWVWTVQQGRYATGWGTVAEAGLTVLLCGLLLAQPRRWPYVAALLVLVWAEYKVYGTSRRFNSMPGSVDTGFHDDARTGGTGFSGVDPILYAYLRKHPDSRIALVDGPFGTDLRHYGLTTPQGFDPFLPSAYRKAVEKFVHFETNRVFSFDWRNEAMLDAFAVRFVLSYQRLPETAHLRLLEPAESYYKVYEYISAKPAWRFEHGSARRIEWTPQRRVMEVDSPGGGELQHIEQFFPGWEARVDGEEVPIQRAGEAFQRIAVPPGSHRVEFRYRSKALRVGAGITSLSLLVLVAATLWRWRRGRR